MLLPNSRFIFLAVFVGCITMMGVALYMEHVMQLEPCNLCILQRVAVIFTGLIALIAAIHGANTSGIKIYGYLIVLTSLVGSGLSARQLWLQSLPADQVPACGASLDYLLDVFSLGEVLSMVLSGDGECAKVVWSFLGLSIPGWLLIAFLGLITIGFFQVLRAKR